MKLLSYPDVQLAWQVGGLISDADFIEYVERL
jgi:hypothetical protein